MRLVNELEGKDSGREKRMDEERVSTRVSRNAAGECEHTSLNANTAATLTTAATTYTATGGAITPCSN